MKSAYYSYRRLNTRRAMQQKVTQTAAPVLPSILNCYRPVQAESGLRFALRQLLGKLPRVASH